MAQPIGNTVQPYNATQTLQSGLFKPFQQAGSLLTGGLNKVTSGIEGAFPNAQGNKTPAPSPFQPLPKIGNFTPSPQLQASANQAKSGGLVKAPNSPVVSMGGVLPTAAPDYSGGTQNPNYSNFQMGGNGTGAGTPALTPSPVRGLFPDVVSSLAGSGAANSAYGDRAQAITDKYANLINPITRQTLGQEVGHLTTGTVGVGAGNAAIAAQAGGQLIQGLTAQEDKELAGNAQGITAQGQTQSALTSAGGLAQPQLGSIGQVPFNPTDLSQGSILGTTQPGGVSAAGNLLGQFQGAQAAGAAPGQAQASNTQTAGTAPTNSYAGIYNTANTNAANYSQQQSAINAVGSQALNLMTNLTSPVNPSASQFVNARLNQLNTQFSSPQYAAFNTAIQSLQARIGQALQAGEIPTAATGNAQAIANGNITVGALASTLQQVDKEMSTFVQTQNDLANYAKSQFGAAGGNSGTAAPTNGGTGTFSDQSFYGK